MKGKTEKGQLCVFDPSTYRFSNIQGVFTASLVWSYERSVVHAPAFDKRCFNTSPQKFKNPPTQRNPRPNKY